MLPSTRFLSLAAASAVIALSACLAAGTARAADGADPARFRLTPALLDRMDAVAAELKDLKAADDDDDDAESVEDIARKLEARPRVRSALARQRLTGKEYATAMLAALHAGMYLATERAADPQGQSSFTPEQRANIEVMRARRKP
ncbi:hypothetical protein EGT29_15210 [Pigmentiphaga sp. H8]|uniref:hypothetical protein n=1 Tax=unclassified Pigmentiphaga TaxID=2626614 RepID=UPI000F590B4B|nr:hypothetical protein [Pigmentiphaga sp. H8]AZG09102.1 hypothetical protein EGT29_15210 [Pigmentiphaga sp. H8]